MLEIKQEPNTANHWKCKFCLIMWLISILKAPFVLFSSHACESLCFCIDLINELIETSPNSFSLLVPILSSTLMLRDDVSELTRQAFVDNLFPKIFVINDSKFISKIKIIDIKSTSVECSVLSVLVATSIKLHVANQILEKIDFDSIALIKSSKLKKNLIKLIQVKPIFLIYSALNVLTKVPLIKSYVEISYNFTVKLCELMNDSSFDIRYSCCKGFHLCLLLIVLQESLQG
ncbi:hypothetical protein MXB_3122 [Myxobolus squamalis]|nr:hypothetical protein MXB_3122 [Myxobolus squamalis]